MKTKPAVLRRIASLLVIVLLLTPLAACSKKPALDLGLDDLAVYDVAEYTVGDQFSYIQSMIWANGEIVALASDMNGLTSLQRISTTGQIIGSIALDQIPGWSAQPGSVSLDGLYNGPAGNIFVTATNYSDAKESVRTLYQLDPTGKLISSLPVFVAKNDGSTTDYLQNIQVTPDGNLLLIFGTGLQLLDTQGKKISEYKLDGKYISLTLFMANGHVSISYYEQTGGIKSEEIDLKTGTKVQDLTLPPQLFNAAPMLGSDGKYYLNGSQYLSRYDEASGKIVKLLSWLDLDVNRNNMAYMWIVAPDGTFYFGEYIYPENNGGVVYASPAVAETAAVETAAETSAEIDATSANDVTTTETSEPAATEPAVTEPAITEPMPPDYVPPANPVFKLLKLSKSADQSAIKKTNITIGAFWLNESLRKSIIDFKKIHPEVRFTVLDYSENIDYSKQNAYEDSIARINADIIAGKMPDLMLVSQLPWRQYANKGLLEDLGSLMDKDKTFNKDLYLTNFLDASRLNGKLYTLSTSVVLTGIMTSKDLVGERTGWTVQEFQQFVEQQPNPKNLFYQMPGESLLNMLLMGNLNAYIDTEKGTASFDTPDFIQLLEFSKKYGVSQGEMEGREGMDAGIGSESQFPALQMAYLSRFEDYSMYNANYNNRAVLLGLPSAQKTGPMMQGGSALALAANSRNKDLIWEFFKFMLSEEQQDLMIKSYEGFPLMRSSLQKAGQKAIEDTKTLDPDRNPNGAASSKADSAYWYGARVTETDVAALIRLLSSANSLLSYDEKANQLIYEETQNFFNGNKTAAETAASIQSRLKAYVGEQ